MDAQMFYPASERDLIKERSAECQANNSSWVLFI